MNKIPTDTVTLLIVCKARLDQKSLYTAVKALPLTTEIATTADTDSALQLAQQLKPDALLIDANSLQGEVITLLERVNELCPKVICVVLMAAVTSMKKIRFFESGADFVFDDRNLDREFTQILSNIKAYQQNR